MNERPTILIRDASDGRPTLFECEGCGRRWSSSRVVEEAVLAELHRHTFACAAGAET